MGSTISVSNDVRVALDHFVVSVRPLEGQFNVNLSIFDFSHTFDVNNFVMNGVSTFVELSDEFRDATIILMLDNFGTISTLIDDGNLQTCVEEGGFP